MVLALQECGRKLRIYLSREKRNKEQDRKRNYIETYLPHIGIGLRDLLNLPAGSEKSVSDQLMGIMERARE